MPRIEIELTSARDDGTWTWRAAGARQPKGVLESSLLYAGAKVGDVVRAEADFEIDGISIVSVNAPRQKRAGPERLEVIGTQRDTPGVTSSVTPRAEGPRRERRRPDRDQQPGRERPPRDQQPGRERPPRDQQPGRERPPREQQPGRERPARDGRPVRERPSADRTRSERPPRRSEAPVPAEPPAPRPKPKKLQPKRAHRDAVLAGLPPEQQPIAEQVLKGGLAAVRQAVDHENAKAMAEGLPEIKADALVALAEELLPRLRAAEWLDRAEAAVRDVEEIALRDLRSLVASSDAADRDEAGRALAHQLRTALDQRVATLRDTWLAEVLRSLDEGRVVRALRISGRPPEPGTRVPPELAGRLTEAASAAMSPETAPARWATVLEAVAASPVRRSVKPTGLPPDPGDELLEAAKKAAGQVPAVAALLGMEVPPPPTRPARPGRLSNRRPPPPPKPLPTEGPPDYGTGGASASSTV